MRFRAKVSHCIPAGRSPTSLCISWAPSGWTEQGVLEDRRREDLCSERFVSVSIFLPQVPSHLGRCRPKCIESVLWILGPPVLPCRPEAGSSILCVFELTHWLASQSRTVLEGAQSSNCLLITQSRPGRYGALTPPSPRFLVSCALWRAGDE